MGEVTRKDGPAAYPMTTTLAKGITSGMRAAMERDPKVILMGEDIGKLGGVFRVTEGLQKDFGEDRVIDTPLAESGIMGTAVGQPSRRSRCAILHRAACRVRPPTPPCRAWRRSTWRER